MQRTSKCSRTPTLWTSGFMAGAREMNEWGHMRLKGSFSKGKKIINIALLLVLKGSVKSLSVSITDTMSYFLWHEVSSMLIALSFTNTFKLLISPLVIICKWGSSREQVSVSMYYLNAGILFAKSSSL